MNPGTRRSSAWLAYAEIARPKTNLISPDVKEANDFWNNAYKEMEK